MFQAPLSCKDVYPASLQSHAVQLVCKLGDALEHHWWSVVTFDRSYEMTLNRYTGILNVTIISAGMQCEVIEKKEKLF